MIMKNWIWMLAILAVICVLILYFSATSPLEEVKCPKCGGRNVWTPIDTNEENHRWICLECGYVWERKYEEKVFVGWYDHRIEKIRDAVLSYILSNHPDAGSFIPDNISNAAWKELVEIRAGGITYIYEAHGWMVNVTEFTTPEVRYLVTADFSITRISNQIGIMHRIIWEGEFLNSGKLIENKYIHAF